MKTGCTENLCLSMEPLESQWRDFIEASGFKCDVLQSTVKFDLGPGSIIWIRNPSHLRIHWHCECTTFIQRVIDEILDYFEAEITKEEVVSHWIEGKIEMIDMKDYQYWSYGHIVRKDPYCTATIKDDKCRTCAETYEDALEFYTDIVEWVKLRTPDI